jgi:hypothetical protein
MAISAGASALALVLTLLIKEVRHVAPEDLHRPEAALPRVTTRTRGM